jgi:type IV pilus assembly protein PilW
MEWRTVELANNLMMRYFGKKTPMGYTLVELLVALAIATIAMASVYTVYSTQQKEHRSQQSTLSAQQNIRGALMVLEQEIRMIGYDPKGSKQFGITDIRRYDVVSNIADPNGQPSLGYSVDWNENGQLEGNENYMLRMRNDLKLRRLYLTMSIGAGGRQRLAENIETVGFAYAVDLDRNGKADTWNGGPHTIWVVDSDNDNRLDTHLDANDDGQIDEHDDKDGNRMITGGDGAEINPPIPIDRIKAVRIWLLSVTDSPIANYFTHRVYTVGDRIISQNGDGLQRRVLEMIVECRNL